MEAAVLEIEDFQSEDIMSINHSQLSGNLIISLAKYRKQYSIMPELEFELDYGRVKPDISICNSIKIDWIHDVIRAFETPLTAIEILSPKQAFNDITDKIYDIYFPSGVKSCWIIIPVLKTVHILTPDGKQQIFQRNEIAKDETNNLELSVEDIFAE
jgi:Uma2 family endonuclease